MNDDGTHLRRIVPETEQGQGPGAWSRDGKRFFYLGGQGEVFLRIPAGILGWLRKPIVIRLTASGQFRTPPAVDPVNPRRLYAVGSILRGETTRYDRKARRWVPFLGGFSGEKIDRSPDGQWLAYIAFPGSELHKCRIDGSSDVLLAPGVEAVNPSWSPDGRQVAFSGRPAGTFVNFKVWLVSPDGGDAAPYPPGDRVRLRHDLVRRRQKDSAWPRHFWPEPYQNSPSPDRRTGVDSGHRKVILPTLVTRREADRRYGGEYVEALHF